jgi:MoaA/NifB/PqqE/SkfB family radical SAM enzyme
MADEAMIRIKEKIDLGKALLRNPQMLRARPALNWFLFQYLRKFRTINVGGQVIVHSHLPPLNHPAYKRFVNEHLLSRPEGPSHAQVGLTNACPQKCAYCYNKGRKGQVMDTPVLKKVIGDLKAMGVFWLGLTGGEPLLNRDIVEITESAAADCAVKLFTTGSTLTPQLAADLRQAGVFSVSVSLDHWREDEHDRARGTRGAFREALRAIEIFKNLGSIHVGVSAVLSREMILRDGVEEFLEFLTGLEVHEAWLSEAKPSVEAFWKKELVITEDERKKLVALQDRYNRERKITVNYLAHFEGREHFGCNAGHKMVYVDAFGEVSPCVFLPLTFGNVRDKSVREIFAGMRQHFPSEESCFVNKNYGLFKKYYCGNVPLGKEESEELLAEVQFGPLSRFFEIYYGQDG